ncbi:MAG: alpha/beta hydrolase [Sterolibacterium sp.]|nr:alpha/beta hydrolase [Sterolibacterium sp.]
MKQSFSEFIELRGMRIHARIWGPINAPQLFLLHGWMDVSATFQFLVDALTRDWRVIAPDWRGFGLSQWNNHSYWFPDYVADLDALLAHYSPDTPARLVGHSMGGNAACLYAGIRPERVASLVSLEGFGLYFIDSAEAPDRYAKWLDQLRAGPAFTRYANRAEFAARLRRGNTRLTADQATFLAEHLGRETSDKQVVVAGDPFHKLPNPVRYRLDEAKACWRRVVAPVLWVAARDSFIMKSYAGKDGEADFKDRNSCFRDIRVEVLEDAGHNLHHDQPVQVARLIEEFCS